ncbi:carbamoyltransferase N-terminal domain-containing protein [Micromonospora sp. NPDC051196]|uniref:carbamoyltransferase N-terminal domain-containing protein n=1 Tax=Micromonospora sp. NPDC051196 TaxID=3155281 RepID=UPI003422DACE
MIVCGVKVTHDSGVALVDNGRLVMSVELEKIGNNLRHSRMDDLGTIEDLLGAHGYDLGQVDRLVFDGWRNTEKLKKWNDQEVMLRVGPYRRGMAGADLLTRYEHTVVDLPYSSYSHYAGHVASAYCTSPFAHDGQPSYVLCWDGRMFPFLYLVHPDGKVRSVCPLLHLLGDAYRSLAQLFPPFYPPFDGPVEAQVALAVPGKVMAYAALGEVDEAFLAALAKAYESAGALVFGGLPMTDAQANERLGRAVLDQMRSDLVSNEVRPEDGIASVQHFVGDLLVRSLVAAVERDGRRSGNLCLVGGCALNIKWNSAIRRSGVADEVWVPPFPNDAGSAIGAACCALLTFADDPYLRWSPYAGPALNQAPILPGWTSVPCSVEELAAVLHSSGAPVVYLDGRAELGPRALGHRSILAPAVSAGMRDVLNEVKGREGYRPVAPMCLVERAGEVFDPGIPDPFMLFDHDVRPQWRDRVPAICHVDGSARLQTVSVKDEPRLHALLSAYESLSGVPLLCNTSANLSGRGFFPDVRSAMQWGKIPRIWSDDRLYTHESITPSGAS